MINAPSASIPKTTENVANYSRVRRNMIVRTVALRRINKQRPRFAALSYPVSALTTEPSHHGLASPRKRIAQQTHRTKKTSCFVSTSKNTDMPASHTSRRKPTHARKYVPPSINPEPKSATTAITHSHGNPKIPSKLTQTVIVGELAQTASPSGPLYYLYPLCAKTILG